MGTNALITELLEKLDHMRVIVSFSQNTDITYGRACRMQEALEVMKTIVDEIAETSI